MLCSFRVEREHFPGPHWVLILEDFDLTPPPHIHSTLHTIHTHTHTHTPHVNTIPHIHTHTLSIPHTMLKAGFGGRYLLIYFHLKEHASHHMTAEVWGGQFSLEN
jgi:hypothetical protein